MIRSSDLGLADGFTFVHTDKRCTFLLRCGGKLVLVCGTRWTIYADVHGMEPEQRGEAVSFDAAVEEVRRMGLLRREP